MPDKAQFNNEMLLLAFKAMVDNSPDLVFVKDINLKYVICSRLMAELVGLSDPKELFGKTDYDVMSPEYADSFIALDHEIIETGRPVKDILVRIPTKEDGLRYATTSKFPLRDSAGNIIGIYGIGRDITEQMTRAESLRISEEEYRLAIEHSGKLIYRYNHADGSVDLPETVTALFGLQSHLTDVPEGLVEGGKVTDTTEGPYRDFFAAIQRGDKSGKVHVCRKTSTGDWRWYSGLFFTIFGESGKPFSTIIVFEDVTDEREEQAAAMLDRSRFMAALDTIYPVLISVNLTQGTYEVAADSEHILKLDAPQGSIADMVSSVATRMTHSAAKRFLHAFQYEELERVFAKTGDSVRMEYEQLDEEGGKRWLELVILRVQNDFSDDIMGIVACRSIDTQKSIEDKLRQAERDGMTDIYNKTATEEMVASRLACLDDKPCALLVADLDDLKNINDSLGHIEGDKAIVRLAHLLKRQFRQSDIVGRVGGDEFVVFLEGVGEENLNSILASFMCKLSTLFVGEDDSYAVTCSIGVAMGETGDSYEDLFMKADKALYREKRGGKAKFVFYKPEMEDGL